MTDNMPVTPGSGLTLRSTDASGVHLQHILAGEKQRSTTPRRRA